MKVVEKIQWKKIWQVKAFLDVLWYSGWYNKSAPMTTIDSNGLKSCPDLVRIEAEVSILPEVGVTAVTVGVTDASTSKEQAPLSRHATGMPLISTVT